MARLVLCLAAALSAQVAPAAEAPLGVVAVADPPGPPEALAALAGELREALAARGAEVLAGPVLRERMGGGPSPARLAELDRAYAAAVAAHGAGDFQGAERALLALVAELERLPPAPEVHAQWTRAALRLARAEQSSGRRDEALALLDRVLRVAPGLKVEARLYPPGFLRLVEEARGRVRADGTRRLAVDAEPGVTVLVEGREVGAAPLALDLPPGRYRVSGALGGLRIPGRPVDLTTGDGDVLLDAAGLEDLRPDAGPGLALPAADRPRRVAAAGARLGLARVVAVSTGQEGGGALVASLHDVERGTAEREGWVRLEAGSPPAGALEALAAFLVSGTPSPLVVAVVPAPGPDLSLPPASPAASPGPRAQVPAAALPPPAPGPGKGRSRTLGWTAVGLAGAGAVLAGVSAYQAVQATRQYDDAAAMKDPAGTGVVPPYTVDQYNALVRAADHDRAVAIGTGVGAGVALATSAVLGWMSWRQSGEIGPFRF